MVFGKQKYFHLLIFTNIYMEIAEFIKDKDCEGNKHGCSL